MTSSKQNSKQASVPPASDDSKYDFTYTQNRELSWLQFDRRVLEEATDANVPLFERLRMAAIFESNLDEFVMVRVGSLSDLASLKRQPIDNKSNQTPGQQLASIYDALPALIAEHDGAVAQVERELAEVGIQRVGWQDFTEEDMVKVQRHFDDVVLPVASPQIIGSRHPFPNLRNKLLYTVFHLTGAEESGLLGLIELPPTLPRVLALTKRDRTYRYTLLEDVLFACATELFGGYLASERAVIRVTRNADIDPDEGTFDIEDDYRQHMKKMLKQRQRLNPVRLEVQGDFPKQLVKRMRKALELEEQAVFFPQAPLAMGDFAFGLDSAVPSAMAANLDYTPFSPQHSARVDDNKPVCEQIEDHDILLFYPYESMDPFLRLLHESATDPNVMQIKITLYRVAKKSRLCESLIAAAENGIDVTVLMELRARFDEENNIEWAERLEDAGCTVLYGSAGFKVHSKICQITRRTNGQVTRITQLGTGNYNEKTAGVYADYSYMTADPKIGEDANKFFRNMQIGNLNGSYTMLGVAPVGLKPLIMRCLNREIEKARGGEEAYVCFKMNSLTDREVIDKLSEASCAGVKIDLIIRGICCLLPGVPSKTENINVRCIVGRKLEHARVYMFGSNHDTVYLSSADMMTRNTDHRVEIAYPIMGADLVAQIYEDIRLQLADNVKARILTSDGTYVKPARAEGEAELNCQEYFIGRAIRAAYEKERRVADEERSARKRPIPTGGAGAAEAAPAPEPVAVDAQAAAPIAAAVVAEPVVEVAEKVAAPAVPVTPVASEPVAVPAPAAPEPVAAPAPQPAVVAEPAIEAAETIAEHAEAAVAQVEQEALDAVERIAAAPAATAAAVEGVAAAAPSAASTVPAFLEQVLDQAQAAPAAAAQAAQGVHEQAEEAAKEAAEKVAKAVSAVPEPEATVVEATTLPSDEEREAARRPVDASEAVSLMVQQKGRGSTGWALIKMGFKVLFSGKA